MYTEDTIAAISTPPGHSGIGIVRLTGKDAIQIADKIFHSFKKKKLKNTSTHHLLFGHIVNPSDRDVVDEVLVSIMKAPNTYTKEDTVEINCHGGPMPLRMILELVLAHGARLANPGEFTQRAFLNGRIDLAQAEAVLDIINSLTVESQKIAVQQLRGTLSKEIEDIRDRIIELAARVEAYIDFPEEDIESLSVRDMKKRALTIKQSLKKLIQSSRYGIILREGLKTAIIGRPNVGKSSLLNALLEQDRAIVTENPGTTRDVIEDYVSIRGLPVKIMDTAGIRSVEDVAEKEGVKRSIQSMKDADIVLLVLDGSEALHDTDIELIEKANSQNTIFIINKIDLPRKLLLSRTREGMKDFYKKAVSISAKNRKGLEQLKNRILETGVGSQTSSSANIVTNMRHLHALERALSAIDSFITESARHTSPEFLALELRDSLDAIGEILGITTPDDILNRIFSNFCIGK